MARQAETISRRRIGSLPCGDMRFSTRRVRQRLTRSSGSPRSFVTLQSSHQPDRRNAPVLQDRNRSGCAGTPVEVSICAHGLLRRELFVVPDTTRSCTRMIKNASAPAAEPMTCHTTQRELERMAAVRRYNILDTPPDGAFDRITRDRFAALGAHCG